MPKSLPMPTSLPLVNQAERRATDVPAWLVLLLAASCGLIGANVYYAQPLIAPIAADLGLSAHASGLIMAVGQIGYGAGLLLVVPLGDLLENRRLVVGLIAFTAASLLLAALSRHAALFLPASLAIGLGAVAVQVLVPYAANLAPDAVRGRVVGNVMSGLMLGIMLARPAAGLITDLLSWHAVFFTSAVLMVALAVGLRAVLPARWPEGGVSYGSLLMSMAGLARHTPILRRRAAYQAGLFSAYSVFWTTVPLLLADRFQLSQSGIALFAIAGVAGTIAAPIAGRVADRGWSRPATLAALLVGASAFLIGLAGHSITVLVIAANLLDFGVAANLVLGQRAIFSLGANMRSRLNALYMAMFFGAGGLGSAVGAWAYAQGGWTLSSWIGFGLPIAAALVWVRER
jgi:predicted MFS family arabinose efflux permease